MEESLDLPSPPHLGAGRSRKRTGQSTHSFGHV